MLSFGDLGNRRTQLGQVVLRLAVKTLCTARGPICRIRTLSVTVTYLFIYFVVQIESRDHIGDDTRLITVSIVAMLVLATVTGCSFCRCTCADCGHVTLAYMGVVAALLAILGAFGLLSLIGSRFVNLSSVMPFLVLGNSAYLLTHGKGKGIVLIMRHRPHTASAAALCVTDRTDVQPRPQSVPMFAHMDSDHAATQPYAVPVCRSVGSTPSINVFTWIAITFTDPEVTEGWIVLVD